jgi:hypothetical protein
MGSTNQQMIARLVTIAACVLAAGCGGSKELEKEKPSAENKATSYEKSFRPSDYDRDIKAILAELKNAQELKAPPPEPPKPEPLVVGSGFRVQLLATTDVDEVNAMKAEAEAAFVGEWFYIIFDPPMYKLRAGNFVDREQAEAYAKLLQDSGYEEAWVVPEKVFKNIPPRTPSVQPTDTAPRK